MKYSVCALIFRGDKILSVSRKNDPTKFGLVGGKVDEGETLIEALFRETKEETGLEIVSYKEVYTRIDDIYECTTFLCETSGDINVIDEKETGVIKELTWEELFKGPFGEYNKGLFNHLYN